VEFTGKQLLELFEAEITNDGSWQLPRREHVNSSSKFSLVIGTGKVSNRSIGKLITSKDTISKKLIISVEPIKYKKSHIDHHNDIFELSYLNNIYIYSLGNNWEFESRLGQKMLARVFSMNTTYQINNSVTHISGLEATHLTEVLLRLNEGHIILNTINKLDIVNQKVQNIILITNLNMEDVYRIYSLSVEYQADLILSYALSDLIIEVVSNLNLPFIFLQRNAVLNEIVKELRYFVKRELNTDVELINLPIKNFSKIEKLLND
jgi:hypothetical protein